MDRITQYTDHGIVVRKELDIRVVAAEDFDNLQHILSVLAAYENTGLAPEEIMDGKMLTGWVPVKERLPEEKGVYLVSYHPCYWDRVNDEICTGIDTFRGKSTWAKKKYQRVIAWMPLPESYKPDTTKPAADSAAPFADADTLRSAT